MGVSVKTVEAWEAGRNTPNGTACRMLAITKANPAFPSEMKIVEITPPKTERKEIPIIPGLLYFLIFIEN